MTKAFTFAAVFFLISCESKFSGSTENPTRAQQSNSQTTRGALEPPQIPSIQSNTQTHVEVQTNTQTNTYANYTTIVETVMVTNTATTPQLATAGTTPLYAYCEATEQQNECPADQVIGGFKTKAAPSTQLGYLEPGLTLICCRIGSDKKEYAKWARPPLDFGPASETESSCGDDLFATAVNLSSKIQYGPNTTRGTSKLRCAELEWNGKKVVPAKEGPSVIQSTTQMECAGNHILKGIVKVDLSTECNGSNYSPSCNTAPNITVSTRCAKVSY